MSVFKLRIEKLPPKERAASDLYRDVLKLGSAVRVARSERNWLQQDLAARSQVAQPDISDIENGTLAQGPTALTLCRLAKALGMRLTLAQAPAVVQDTSLESRAPRPG